MGCKYSECTSLTSVTIPESVTSIGRSTFSGCSSLTSITIPNGVKVISNKAFEGCSSLSFFTIPDSATVIAFDAFRGCYFLRHMFINNSALMDFNNWGAILYDEETDDGLLISGPVIVKCRSWAISVNIPNSATSIRSEAFRNCSCLTSITIPNSVTSIGDNSFEDCSSLTSITIPESVTKIGRYAFRYCKLRNVLIKCTTPPALEDKVGEDRPETFSQSTCHHAMLYVPAGRWDAYAFDDGWFWFNNIRETTLAEEEVSEQQAYTLMDANTFVYSVYDPVNDCIGTINSAGSINEDNPNHSWQMIEAGGAHYLYNIGAKKYVRRNGNSYELTDTPTAIDVEDGENSLILGAQTDKQWALVSNESMSVNQAIITGVPSMEDGSKTEEGAIYNLAGQRLQKMQKGINIVGGKKIAY